MKSYKCENIRNIALAGHNASGKTTLAEALLFKGGAVTKLGKVTDGNTVCDHDPEEIKRKISINTAFAYLEWKNVKINLLDTPGQFDFIGSMPEGVRAAETVLITVSAKDGCQVGTIKAFNEAKKQNKAVVFVITKVDEEGADFGKAVASLKDRFGTAVCELTDRDALAEIIAGTDEELMNKFLETMELSDDEFNNGLPAALARGEAALVVDGKDIDALLDLIVSSFPSPKASAGEPLAVKDGEEAKYIKFDDTAKSVSAFVFKTVADPFGKMSFAKIVTGSLGAKSEPTNTRTGEVERFGKFLTLRGKKQEDLEEAFAGDIVVITKIDAITGDTLCSADAKNTAFAQIEFPPAVFFKAIAAKGKGDEVKISSAIKKVLEEDRVLSYVNNAETRQRVIGGLGDQHLDVVVSKMKAKFGVDVELSDPIIAYRETIRKKVTGVEGTHKKQSGGAGQYGKVVMDFEPHSEDELVFEEKIVGGTVSKQFFPAVEKGLRESILHGAVAGYPVVRLKATLMDGKMHPVDSKEVAFISAAK
ncbi:MAG: GTP-binding protein, partial [Oscillospiraceae bacterium]|nr:GTP-binding protein [Oscillospiraceae bacterium]